jgi:hypothetical protein
MLTVPLDQNSLKPVCESAFCLCVSIACFSLWDDILPAKSRPRAVRLQNRNDRTNLAHLKRRARVCGSAIKRPARPSACDGANIATQIENYGAGKIQVRDASGALGRIERDGSCCIGVRRIRDRDVATFSVVEMTNILAAGVKEPQAGEAQTGEPVVT